MRAPVCHRRITANILPASRRRMNRVENETFPAARRSTRVLPPRPGMCATLRARFKSFARPPPHQSQTAFGRLLWNNIFPVRTQVEVSICSTGKFRMLASPRKCATKSSAPLVSKSQRTTALTERRANAPSRTASSRMARLASA